jgi:DNA repair exonuclease SbcCD ATPase subunit
MISTLPNAMQSLVIQQWLLGMQRDVIAHDTGLGAGTVTNTVNEWRRGLGVPTADELRELATSFRKVGITPAQCALGFRVAMIMERLGVKEDDFERFILDGYNRCTDLGVSPEKIASHLKDLLEFSNSRVVPLPQISEYIKEKEDEKKKLEQEIQKLEDQKETLAKEKSVSEDLRNAALDNEKMTANDLKWYSDIREELKDYQIPVDDLSLFVNIISNIKRYGYDPKEIISEFSNLKNLEEKLRVFTYAVANLKVKVGTLSKTCNELEQKINFHSQTLSIYNELDAIGFGLKELKLIWSTINEIAAANNISVHIAVQKFLQDIEEQYDDKLGFESKIENSRDEFNRLNQEVNSLRVTSSAHPMIGGALSRLFIRGVKEQDIIAAAELFERFIGPGGIEAGIRENIHSLITDLKKYGGGIKQILHQLNQEENKLRNEIATLQIKKKELEVHIEQMLSALVYSKQVVGFLDGRADSLKYAIMELLSIIAFIMQLFYPYFESLQKFGEDRHHNKFVALIRAAKIEDIPTPELKTMVVEAIEVIVGRSDTRDTLKEILSETRLAVINQEDN